MILGCAVHAIACVASAANESGLGEGCGLVWGVPFLVDIGCFSIGCGLFVSRGITIARR